MFEPQKFYDAMHATSALACLKVAKEFVVGLGWVVDGTRGYYVYTRRNSTPFKATLKQIASGFDNISLSAKVRYSYCIVLYLL